MLIVFIRCILCIMPPLNKDLNPKISLPVPLPPLSTCGRGHFVFAVLPIITTLLPSSQGREKRTTAGRGCGLYTGVKKERCCQTERALLRKNRRQFVVRPFLRGVGSVWGRRPDINQWPKTALMNFFCRHHQPCSLSEWLHFSPKREHKSRNQTALYLVLTTSARGLCYAVHNSTSPG